MLNKLEKYVNNWKEYYNNTYFSEYAPDPFVADVNTEIYHQIFKDYIAEKSSKLVVVEKRMLEFNTEYLVLFLYKLKLSKS